MNLSIIGAWQVFANVGIANVGITFERINIFTCGKKHGNRDESGNRKVKRGGPKKKGGPKKRGGPIFLFF